MRCCPASTSSRPTGSARRSPRTRSCARHSALSRPAVAPDITRTFEPSHRYPTTTPLPDELIGNGGETGWDGVRGPMARRRSVDYPALATRTMSWPHGRRIRHLGDRRTKVDQYIARTLTMARAYEVLGVTATADKVHWVVLSFRAARDRIPTCSRPAPARRRRCCHRTRTASRSPGIPVRDARHEVQSQAR